ncbi:MAG: AAA family ATPase [Phycisphaerales bacterium]|nr:MAG: AAA family ATPase [Phycisphaerales bacterium]
MRRIAVINQKGGVGKTTTVASLGAALASADRRVLLVDLDPQAHLSLHFGVELEDDQPSAYDLLTASAPVDQVAIKARENVLLVPSDIDLAAAEAELVSVMGREMILREAVDLVEANHDVMLIDCPPSLGVLTINALAAAEEVIIPLQAHFFALQGVSKLLDTVTLVRQRINANLRVSGFVLCMHEQNTRLAGEVVADLTQFLEASRSDSVPWARACIYNSPIRRNIKLAEASSFGQTVFDYAPTSNGAIDYSALASEVFGIRKIVSSNILDSPRVTPRVPPAPAGEATTAEIPTQTSPNAPGERPIPFPQVTPESYSEPQSAPQLSVADVPQLNCEPVEQATANPTACSPSDYAPCPLQDADTGEPTESEPAHAWQEAVEPEHPPQATGDFPSRFSDDDVPL